MKIKECRLRGVKIGIVMTASHCTIADIIPQLENLKNEGAELFPVFSYSMDIIDNRFYNIDEIKATIMDVCQNEIINTIVGAEPIGPEGVLDIVLVVPATGNTLAKLANGIVDTPALMAIKAQLRNQKPVVIAISTNDALGINGKNIGSLINMKNIYFVPFRQDNPYEKSNSIMAEWSKIIDTSICALQGKQIQPVLLGPS